MPSTTTSSAPPTGYDSSSSSYFILEGLPQGAEFGLDSQLWTVDKFSGVKFLPPGLHFFIFSAAARSTGSEAAGAPGSLGVRHGLLRVFKAGETLADRWDDAVEGLVSDRTRTRSRIADQEGDEILERAVSLDQIKSLDKSLAAYPSLPAWRSLVGYITADVLARVVGLDGQGCARVDALMASSADEGEIYKAGEGKSSWGKERPNELDALASTGAVAGALEEVALRRDEDELLLFTEVNLKKSWPPGAIGADLSRWSVDKSWLLSRIVQSLGGDSGPSQVLAEVQLAFILFALLHNFSALAAYKTLLSAFCRSSALLLPLSTRPVGEANLLGLPALPLMVSFLKTVFEQLRFLPDDFFTLQMPSLDSFFLEELDLLHSALIDARSSWDRSSEGSGPQTVWSQCVDRWEEIRVLGTEKWGWQLGEVKRRKRTEAVVQREEKGGASRGSKWDDDSSDEDGPPAKVQRGQLEEEWSGYVDIEDLEEGEDAPVIVEM